MQTHPVYAQIVYKFSELWREICSKYNMENVCGKERNNYLLTKYRMKLLCEQCISVHFSVAVFKLNLHRY